MCPHDWRLSRERVIEGRHAGIYVICEDCRALGIIYDASQQEVEKVRRAKSDGEYRPVFTGSQNRIHVLGEAANDVESELRKEQKARRAIQLREARERRKANA